MLLLLRCSGCARPCPGAGLRCAAAAEVGSLCRGRVAGGSYGLWLPFKGQNFKK